MQKNRKNPIRVLTTAALLAALSAVVGILCKNLFTFNVYYRVTFENAPVILAGLLFGPAVGAAVGVCGDAVSCLMSTNPALNPIISAGAAAVGAMAGLAPYIIKGNKRAQTALAVGLAHLVGQVAVKSVGKIIYFSMPWQGVFLGLGISLAVGVAEWLLLCWLREVKGLERFMGGRSK